ncbi:MAG: acyltransferase family protein [Acidimicrobiia bacterium]
MDQGAEAPGVERAPRLLAHNSALDGIRGIAVVGVLFFHAGHLAGGYLGVDAFFVLSGFLITTLLLAERVKTGTISFGSFWIRRARRLLPALFIVILAVLAYAAFYATTAELSTIRRDALATLAYVANWNSIFSGKGYFAAFSAPSPLEHTWSLAIEEQFYLLWPVAVFALCGGRKYMRSPRAVRRVFRACVAITVLSAGWAIALTLIGADPDRVYMGTDTRIASLTLGAALAAWMKLPKRVEPEANWTGRRIVLEVGATISLALCAWAWIALNGTSQWLFRGGLIACAGGVALAIAAVMHPARGPIHRVFSWKPLAAIGLISYGLYLWHWPIYVFVTPRRTGLDGWNLTGARLGFTFGAAIVSYLLIESPIRYRKLLVGWTPRVVTPTFASALVLVTFGVTAGATAGPNGAAASGMAGNGATQRAAIERLRDQAATPKRPNGPQRVLVVGDSVAYFLGNALQEIASQHNMEVFNVAIPGCGFVRGPMRLQLNTGVQTKDVNVCSDSWGQLDSWLHPDQVIVAFGAPAIAEWERDGTWQHVCEPGYDTYFENAVRFGLSALQQGGARATVALLPEPKMDWAPPSARERNACTQTILERIGRSTPNAAPLDLSPLVCPGGDCGAPVLGVNLRPDGLHFEGPGARITAEWIAQRIEVKPPTSRTAPPSSTEAPLAPIDSALTAPIDSAPTAPPAPLVPSAPETAPPS